MLVTLLALHALAALFWVGGMAFAYTMLRPAAAALEPAMRLPLWRRVFARFLPWVAASILVLLVSGYAMLFMHFGGFKGAGIHIHVMQATGIAMMLLFGHLYFAPWPRFQAAVERAEWPEAARQLNRIRRTVAINLALGVVTVLVGSTGRFW